MSYTISLRGNDGFLLDLDGMNRHRERNDGTYFMITLLGKIKGEHTDIAHIIPCSNITSSGINAKYSIRRVFSSGPAITNLKGFIHTSSKLDELLHDLLILIFEKDPSLFPPTIKTTEDIKSYYHCFRTLRRISDTRALEMTANANDIDIVHRWEKVEKAGGRKLLQPMRQHYAQLELLIKLFCRYTYAI